MSPFERFGGQAPAAYEPPPFNMGGGRTAMGPQRLPMSEADLLQMFMNASPEEQARIYRDLIAPPTNLLRGQ